MTYEQRMELGLSGLSTGSYWFYYDELTLSILCSIGYKYSAVSKVLGCSERCGLYRCSLMSGPLARRPKERETDRPRVVMSIQTVCLLVLCAHDFKYAWPFNIPLRHHLLRYGRLIVLFAADRTQLLFF